MPRAETVIRYRDFSILPIFCGTFWQCYVAEIDGEIGYASPATEELKDAIEAAEFFIDEHYVIVPPSSYCH